MGRSLVEPLREEGASEGGGGGMGRSVAPLRDEGASEAGGGGGGIRSLRASWAPTRETAESPARTATDTTATERKNAACCIEEREG